MLYIEGGRQIHHTLFITLHTYETDNQFLYKGLSQTNPYIAPGLLIEFIGNGRTGFGGKWWEGEG